MALSPHTRPNRWREMETATLPCTGDLQPSTGQGYSLCYYILMMFSFVLYISCGFQDEQV